MSSINNFAATIAHVWARIFFYRTYSLGSSTEMFILCCCVKNELKNLKIKVFISTVWPVQILYLHKTPVSYWQQLWNIWKDTQPWFPVREPRNVHRMHTKNQNLIAITNIIRLLQWKRTGTLGSPRIAMPTESFLFWPPLRFLAWAVMIFSKSRSFNTLATYRRLIITAEKCLSDSWINTTQSLPHVTLYFWFNLK